MTYQPLQGDSPKQANRMRCGAWPTLPQTAAVSRIGNSHDCDRTFARGECA